MKNLALKFALLVSALLPFSSLAISEENYQTVLKNTVYPYFDTNAPGNFFEGVNKLPLFYRASADQSVKKCLIILPGRSEPINKYAELFYDLKTSLDALGVGYHIFLMDHRGQGLSGRETANSQVGYVTKFSDYVDDLDTFVRTVVRPTRCDGITLLAHSMGAGIGLEYTRLYTDTFDRIILSSPMLKIQTKPYPYFIAGTIVRAQVLAKKGKEYALGQKDHNPDSTFEENKFTTSPERFKMANGIFRDYPASTLGGVSNNWILQIMKGTKKLRKSYEIFHTPMLVFTAGIELYSDAKEMQVLCKRALGCENTHLPTSKHEVFMDRDENRNIVLQKTIDFLAR